MLKSKAIRFWIFFDDFNPFLEESAGSIDFRSVKMKILSELEEYKSQL
ncbi:hypothetical protein [Chryseobacterium caseinilyticum]|nr:hypothetical protein [Chryseobacterium caseinilyticum]